MNWWNELTGLQQIFMTVATPATLILVVQFILLLFGLSGEDGADDIFDTDDLDFDAADADFDAGGADFDAGDLDFGAGNIDFDAADADFDTGGVDFDAGDLDFDAVDADFDAGDVGFDTSGVDLDTGDLGFDSADLNTDSAGISEYLEDGMDTDSEAPDDVEQIHKGIGTLRLFTFRGLVAFSAVGGWTGIFAIDRNAHPILAIILALVAGFLAMLFVAWSVATILRMQSSGNIRRENAVGKDGEVYLTIPDNGIGKVNVLVQDRLCEMNATTRAGRDIKTGEKITVIGVVSDGLLLVTPYTDPDGAVIKKLEEVS
jgi:membrane protein implicated in regulation of membrane protease activity